MFWGRVSPKPGDVTQFWPVSNLISIFFSYKGKDTESLSEMRYSKFLEMLTKSSKVEPSELPPTERTAYYHALRVHLQIAQWESLDLHCLDPLEWGWNLENGTVVPIKTDLGPAPECLLNFIRCNCQTTTKNPCKGLTCSCRKHGLECVVACGNCHGELCTNVSVRIMEDPSNDGDEMDRNIFDIFD